MSEEHDIVLKLNIDDFQRGIDQARIHLTGLQHSVNAIGQNIGKVINGIKLDNLNFTQASNTAKQFANNLKSVESSLKNVDKTAAGVKNKVVKAFDFGDALGKNVERGITVGLAHAVGSISVGANPLTAIPHELIRNISISVFHTLAGAYKQVGSAAAAITPQVEAATQSVKGFGEEWERSSTKLANSSQQSASVFSQFFQIVKDNFANLATGIGLVLLGKILDSLGDKFLGFAETLARAAGEANLAFTQLNAVIDTTSKNMGVNLGTAKEWESFLTQLAVTSGSSRKELADFGSAFVQVGADAGLSGEELQKLVTIAAFTRDRFRNATEQLTNFRQALAGNVRFLQNNIPLGTTLNDVTERYAQALQRSGHSQEEATRLSKEASVAKRVLVALDEASIPFVKTATETTGNYAIELRKLNASIENLKISLGTGLEGLFAGATKALRVFIQNLTLLPGPLQALIGYFITITGVIAEVGGALLKLTGYILIVATAWKALNAALLITIPGMGSLVAVLTSMTLATVGPIQPITTLAALLSALFTRLVALITPFLSLSGILSAIGTAFSRLVAFVSPLIARLFTLGAALTALKITAIIGAFFALSEAFSIAGNQLSKIFEKTQVLSRIFKEITDALGLTSASVEDVTDSFFLSERATAAWNVVVGALVNLLELLALGALFAARGVLTLERALNEAKAATAGFLGATDAQQQYQDRVSQLNQTINKVDESLGLLKNQLTKNSIEFQRNLGNITATNQELANLQREAADAETAISFLGGRVEEFSESQLKVLRDGLRGFRNELTQFKAKEAELIGGKAAGDAVRNLEKAKELARRLNEATEKGKGVKVLDDKSIDNASSAKEIFDAIKVVNKELGTELEQTFGKLGPRSQAVEGLERQKTLFKEIIGSINNLKDSFNKEINSLTESLGLQKAFNLAISQSTDNFDALIKNAQLENDIRKATLDVDNKIKEVRDKIENGKIEVQATGKTISVQLTPKEKAQAESELNKLTKERNAIISLKVDELTTKRATDIITDIQKQIEALGDYFEDAFKSLSDESALLSQFNSDLEKGTKFAEDQNALRVKDLVIANKIKDAEDNLLKTQQQISDLVGKGKPEELAILEIVKQRLETEIEQGKIKREQLGDLANEIQITKNQGELTKFIVQQNEALSDQLALIQIRAQLFQSGVITGTFDRTKEQIQALTSSLDAFYKRLIETTREAQANPSLINEQAVDNAISKINDIQEALKRLNVIQDIKEILQTIPDELEKTMTDGLRQVFDGSKKIGDLLKETATNILNNISDIFAKKAFDRIRNGLDDLATQIADSDIFKNIAGAIGIDIGKDVKGLLGGAAKLGTPTEQLNQSTQELDTTNKTLISTIKELITTLGGTSKSKPSTTPTTGSEFGGIIPTTPLPTGLTLPTSVIDFEAITQQITEGTATLEVISETGISGWFEESRNAFSTGLNTLTQSSNTGFSGFFSNFSDLLQKGLKFLTDSIGGLFSGEGGGTDIFASVLKGISSLIGFGAAKGGLIPGEPTNKDNQVRPVASGEYVVNSEAVKAYGPKFFDALNNMSLPQDFFSNLQASGAPAQLASVAPSIGSAINTAQPVQNERPIIVNVIDRAPKLDPAAFKMKPSEVTQIFVDGVKKDRVIRRVIRDDLRNG